MEGDLCIRASDFDDVGFGSRVAVQVLVMLKECGEPADMRRELKLLRRLLAFQGYQLGDILGGLHR